MMKKRLKQVSALLLTAALSFSAVILPQVQAAIAVETDKTDCSVEINVQGEGYFSELSQLPITVNLYKVADVTSEGKYVTVDVFGAAGLDFSGISSETKAEEWGTLASDAKEAVDAGALTEPTVTTTIENGTVTVENLATGLYLVDAQQVLSDYYQYDFTPYLISLPNNYYYESGNDDWVYNLTGTNAIGLKPEKSDRYGDLVINKTLDAYNATIGGATFVFQIEGTKTDVDTKETKVVYSDVVSMTFDGPGTESIKITNIPAGAVVTVTEIYSGASYTLTSDASKTVTIIANEEEGAPATADFSNTYDDRMNGGNGLVNTFTYDDGKWTHSATEETPEVVENEIPEKEEFMKPAESDIAERKADEVPAH